MALLAQIFKSIFDLPSHVFFVHLPVVGIPIVGVGAVAVGTLRRPPSWLKALTSLGALGVTVATWVAVQSGQAFDEVIDGRVNTDKHESLGETTLILTIGLCVAVLASVAYQARDRTKEPDQAMRWVRPALSLATVALAALATIWVIRTGHEGARITWDGVIDS
jgi:H+/Cl- antiporter ClcA